MAHVYMRKTFIPKMDLCKSWKVKEATPLLVEIRERTQEVGQRGDKGGKLEAWKDGGTWSLGDRC